MDVDGFMNEMSRYQWYIFDWNQKVLTLPSNKFGHAYVCWKTVLTKINRQKHKKETHCMVCKTMSKPDVFTRKRIKLM